MNKSAKKGFIMGLIVLGIAILLQVLMVIATTLQSTFLTDLTLFVLLANAVYSVISGRYAWEVIKDGHKRKGIPALIFSAIGFAQFIIVVSFFLYFMRYLSS